MNVAKSIERIEIGGIRIAKELYDFVEAEILQGLGLESDEIWAAYADLLNELVPQNRWLIKHRDALQTQIDDWHQQHAGSKFDFEAYKSFLTEIGYLQPEGAPFEVETTNVDDEIALIAGPQLVVPVNNARFAINAANARWGSLFDAFYGTDVIDREGQSAPGKTFNPVRGLKVIKRSQVFLDEAFPLFEISHADVLEYKLAATAGRQRLQVVATDGQIHYLLDEKQFIGVAERSIGKIFLLKNNGLHIELVINQDTPAGALHPSGIGDIIIESAVSTIMDCEDSVAAVSPSEKVEVYRNWLGLMTWTINASFEKNGKQVSRRLSGTRKYKGAHGEMLHLNGRSLMLVRNVGHLVTTDSVLDSTGAETPEGMLDALITCLGAMYDLIKVGGLRNSQKRSIYVVKPKMHGPQEAAFADRLYSRIEEILGLAPNTVKIGLMDEERRTTVNLKECVRALKKRIVFINTGFLDRTGDEIHTSMHAGPMMPKARIKQQAWLQAYEDWNVDIGLESAMSGKAQIGKGMWARPDDMKEMLETKMDAPLAGASCAWVPSPTGATLHALHYHAINAAAQQDVLKDRGRANLDDILTIPLLGDTPLTQQEITTEIEENAQSILGYVVRWVDQGVGCSKVPDIHDVALMEDRATLRISSQLLANWLQHEICSETQVLDAMKKMAVVVDKQNAHDVVYTPMAPNCDGPAFRAACNLVLNGATQPSGYTEPELIARRQEVLTQAPA
jgi:malate synthase